MSKPVLLPDRHDPFIEGLAKMMVPLGMPPIAARMQGFLTLSPEPLTLDELVRGLKIAKSSASVAARLLERYGIVQCFTERGSKRVRYGVAGNCAGFLGEQSRFIGEMARLLEEAAAAREAGTAARLKTMGAFYGRVHAALDAVLTAG